MKTLLLQIDKDHFSLSYSVDWVTNFLDGSIFSIRSFYTYITYELRDNKTTRSKLYSMMLSLSITMDINNDVISQSGMLTDFIHCVAGKIIG